LSVGKGSINRVNSLKTSEIKNTITKTETLSSNLLDIDKLQPVPSDWQFYNLATPHYMGLKDSILKFGVLEPAVVRRLSDGGFQLLSGYLRVQACREVGLSQIKCEVLCDITDEAAREIYIELHKDKLCSPSFSETKFKTVSSIKTDLPDYLL
jgi:hypothetical protein